MIGDIRHDGRQGHGGLEGPFRSSKNVTASCFEVISSMLFTLLAEETSLSLYIVLGEIRAVSRYVMIFLNCQAGLLAQCGLRSSEIHNAQGVVLWCLQNMKGTK